jgi:predicted transcriptional regulator of viral defense system
MKSGPAQPNARQYLDRLAAGGRYHFSSSEARSALGPTAAKFALQRLAKQGAIASPARGFYVIVPPEYRSLGCLPADQFIPALMKHLKQPYYAGLLTAAQYHGAAHQRPQEFQVFLEKPRLPIECGKVRVKFFVRKRLREVPIQELNTPRGTLRVSTPEATALDLVGYHRRAGGLDQVATVLSELAERLDPDKLAGAAKSAPVASSQRLGHLLERAGARAKTTALKEYVRTNADDAVILLPRARARHTRRDDTWKLIVNVKVEPQL